MKPNNTPLSPELKQAMQVLEKRFLAGELSKKELQKGLGDLARRHNEAAQLKKT